MKSKLFLFVALAALSAVLISACGGGDDSTSSSAPATTAETSEGGTEGGAEGGGDPALVAAEESAAESEKIPTEIEANEFGPVTPEKGALLYFIGCDQSIPGCTISPAGAPSCRPSLWPPHTEETEENPLVHERDRPRAAH